MLEALVDLNLTDDWQHMIDSTTIQGHAQAVGAKGGRPGAPIEPLIALDEERPHYHLADKGYDGDGMRQSLLMRGILPTSNRREPIKYDFQRYRDRNRIERMFGRIKQFRRIATRYDKTALSFLGFLHLAAASL